MTAIKNPDNFTQEDVKQDTIYDYDTGRLIDRKTGQEIGYGSLDKRGKRNGINCTYRGWRLKVHRLIWFREYGYWPDLTIDHRDTNPFNNRLENLRLADEHQQRGNRGKVRVAYNGKPPTSRFPGVSLARGKSKPWLARYKHKDPVTGKVREIYLGRYHTEAEAYIPVRDAHIAEYGEFARLDWDDDPAVSRLLADRERVKLAAQALVVANDVSIVDTASAILDKAFPESDGGTLI